MSSDIWFTIAMAGASSIISILSILSGGMMRNSDIWFTIVMAGASAIMWVLTIIFFMGKV